MRISHSLMFRRGSGENVYKTLHVVKHHSRERTCMKIKRINSALSGLAIAAILALGASATPALADNQSRSHRQQEQSRQYLGDRQPRVLRNQNGSRHNQRHGSRYYGNKQRRYNNRYGYNIRQYGNRHHRHHRYYGNQYRGYHRYNGYAPYGRYGRRGQYRY